MYLNIVQLAESFGVDENVVEGWVEKDGLRAIKDRERLLFDRNQVAEWAAARGMAAKAGFLAARPSARVSAPRLEPMLQAGGIWRNVPAAQVPEVMGKIVARLPGASAPVKQLLAQRLRQPGSVSWAAVGQGLALPHLRAPAALGRDAGILGLIFATEALPLSEPVPDEVPVTRLLFFVAPSPRAHLELLGQLSRALLRGALKRPVLEAAPDADLFGALAASEALTAGPKDDQG